MKKTLLMLLLIATSIFGQTEKPKHPIIEDQVTIEDENGWKILTIFYDGEQDSVFLHTIVKESINSYQYSTIGERYILDLEPKIHISIKKNFYYYRNFLRYMNVIVMRFKKRGLKREGIFGNADVFQIYIGIHQRLWFFENQPK